MDNFYIILLIVIVLLILIFIIFYCSNNNNNNKYLVYTFINDYTEKAKLTILDANCNKVFVNTYVYPNQVYTFKSYGYTLDINFDNPSDKNYTISLRDYTGTQNANFYITKTFSLIVNQLNSATNVGTFNTLTYVNTTSSPLYIITNVSQINQYAKLLAIPANNSIKITNSPLTSSIFNTINNTYIDKSIQYCISTTNNCIPSASNTFTLNTNMTSATFTIEEINSNYVLSVTQG